MPKNSPQNLRGVMHEIKNQLSVIDIQADILNKKGADTNNIDIIKKALSNISDTITNLKKTNSQDTIRKINLDDFLIGVEILSQSLLTNGNKIKIINNSKKEWILAYEKHLNEVVLNVIKNANESTKNDTIKIIVDSDFDFHSIIIENHGEKIPLENQSKIFEENFTTKNNGWGVGLYECKKYMESQNGEITLLKSEDKLTQFLIKVMNA